MSDREIILEELRLIVDRNVRREAINAEMIIRILERMGPVISNA